MYSRHARTLLATSLFAVALMACGAADAEPRRAETASPSTHGAASAADSARDALIARADLGRIKGSDSASVWLVVISDFECPFCKRWHDETAPRIDQPTSARARPASRT